MSSRKLLMYMDGLLMDSNTAQGWYGHSILRDWREKQDADAEQEERELRAINRADVTGQPLRMSDLQA